MEASYDIALTDTAARVTSSLAAGIIYFIYLLIFMLRQNSLRIRWQDAARRSNPKERRKGRSRFAADFHSTHRWGTILLILVPVVHTIAYGVSAKFGISFQPFFLLIIWGAYALMLPVCYFLFGVNAPEE